MEYHGFPGWSEVGPALRERFAAYDAARAARRKQHTPIVGKSSS
ncbi:hypothetical protein [Streptomyces sp. 8K308]|nr:hypothetical protein [Streptomyces sp. 8K308]